MAWICEFRPGNKTIYVVFHEESVSGLRIQEIFQITVVFVETEFISTLVFDEIDAGVSGVVSSEVANLMYNMSRNMQVLTITHLPQVASKGDNHFKVFKYEDRNRTITDIKLLNKSDRINEIAEMLSGKKLNKSAKELANQLLN